MYKAENVITFKAHKKEETYSTLKKPILYPVSTIGFNSRAIKNWIFTGGSDGNLNFWDIVEKNKILTKTYDSPITAVAVSADGKYMIYSKGNDWHKGLDSIGTCQNMVGIYQISEANLSYSKNG